MSAPNAPRKGSLQFWPRKRASKFLPSVNWNAIDSEKKLKGFICYKAGMASAYVKDDTPNSMTKGKKIIVPVTILECPSMKILSVRFYRDGKVSNEILAENIDKELRKKIKLPKAKGKKIEDVKDFEDVRIICYSEVKKTGIKKTPDLTEIGLSGDNESKINFVKEHLGKEMPITSFFEKGQLIDLRGLTKGKGLVGPLKRFGLTLKSHKSEKGRRKPGSLGPWHPARVTFRAPLAGQLGMFTRVNYNCKIIKLGKITEENINPKSGWKNYGNINTDYIILEGSVPGPAKRQLLLTLPLRATKKQVRKKHEFVRLLE